MQNKRYLILLAATLAAVSCSFQDAEWVPVDELVPRTHETLIPSSGGEGLIHIYASGTFTAELIEAGDWAEMLTPAVREGDADIVLRLAPNHSYRRAARVRLTLESSGDSDTIVFKQYGITPSLTCPSPYFSIDGSKDTEIPVPIGGNIEREDLRMEVSYGEGSRDWIGSLSWRGDIAWDDSEVFLPIAASTLDMPTTATVRLLFDDAWGEDIHADLNICRSSSGGYFGQEISDSDFRTAADAGGSFGAYQYITGTVVSDYQSENMALNPNTAWNTVDATMSARTAYIVSEQTGLGTRLVFNNATDNILRQGMRLRIYLDGASAVREDNPLRYTLSGLSGSNILSAEDGDLPVPADRTLATLTDDDIYTLVRLSSLEFLSKEGSYLNVHEGYVLPSPFNPNACVLESDGCASLLADGSLRAIFAPVNARCPWRKSVSGIPQGSGSVTGILVHEELERLGDPGRYQIRVLDEKGFDFTGPSAYATAARWNGENPPAGGNLYSENTAPGSSDALRKGQTFARLDFSGQGCLNNRSLVFNAGLAGWYSFSEEGTPIPDKGIVARMDASSVSGRGALAFVSFLSWGTMGWFRVFPAHWCLEYRTGGEGWSAAVSAVSGAPYVHLRPGPCDAGYQNGRLYYPSSSMSPAFVDNAFVLPAEVLGHSDLAIRIRPYDTVLYDFPQSPGLFNADCEAYELSPDASAPEDLAFAEISIRILQ